MVNGPGEISGAVRFAEGEYRAFAADSLLFPTIQGEEVFPMEIPPLLILKPQPSQGGGADDARLVAQLRSSNGGDGSLPLAETVGGHILPDRGQQGLPLTADAAPQQNHLRGQNIHKVRQSRTCDREWNIDIYVPDTESGEYGSGCSYRCRDHGYL